MNKRIMQYVILGFFAGLLIKGCGKASEQKIDSAAQSLIDTQTASKAEWEKFKRESEGQIESNEHKIAAFKVKMEKSGSKMKSRYRTAIDGLERDNREAKKKLEEFADTGTRNWEEFKKSFTHDMDRMEKAMKETFDGNP